MGGEFIGKEERRKGRRKEGEKMVQWNLPTVFVCIEVGMYFLSGKEMR